MATKLNGFIRLSKIPKELIKPTKKGEKGLFVDIVPRKNGADEYGNTHSVQIYNSATRETIYLGDLKPIEFGTTGGAAHTTTPIPTSGGNPDDDLPW